MWKSAAYFLRHRVASGPSSSLCTLTSFQPRRLLSTAPARQGNDIATDILTTHYEFTHTDPEETLEEPAHSITQRSDLASDILAPHFAENVSSEPGVDTQRISVLMQLTDRVGILHDVLRYVRNQSGDTSLAKRG